MYPARAFPNTKYGPISNFLGGRQIKKKRGFSLTVEVELRGKTCEDLILAQWSTA